MQVVGKNVIVQIGDQELREHRSGLVISNFGRDAQVHHQTSGIVISSGIDGLRKGDEVIWHYNSYDSAMSGGKVFEYLGKRVMVVGEGMLYCVRGTDGKVRSVGDSILLGGIEEERHALEVPGKRYRKDIGKLLYYDRDFSGIEVGDSVYVEKGSMIDIQNPIWVEDWFTGVEKVYRCRKTGVLGVCGRGRY